MCFGLEIHILFQVYCRFFLVPLVSTDICRIHLLNFLYIVLNHYNSESNYKITKKWQKGTK